jgi:serine/threonine protein kinase
MNAKNDPKKLTLIPKQKLFEKCTLGDFQKIETIGKGSHGIVIKAKFAKDNNFYAIKIIDLKKFKESTAKGLEKEGEILQGIFHKNVIKCYKVFKKNSKIHLVLEYAEGGDLHQVERYINKLR